MSASLSPALLRSLRLAEAGTKLHPNAARPLFDRGLITRGKHRDWLTRAGRTALRAADDALREPNRGRRRGPSMIGRRFNHLRVGSEFFHDGVHYCRCRCDCGKEVVRRASVLSQRTTAHQSCGHARGAFNRKLTNADVRDIRQACASLRYNIVNETAKRYGLTPTYVSMLITGQRRADAGGPMRRPTLPMRSA